MSANQQLLLCEKSSGGSSFPITRTYNSGIAATETIPAGASTVLIIADGGGGGAATCFDGQPFGNSGSGAQVLLSLGSITAGQTFIYTVGALVGGHPGTGQGNGTDGNASTVVSGTDTNAVNIIAGGGHAGTTASNGAGGPASGGDSNFPGGNASASQGGSSPGGGAGGIWQITANHGFPPGGGGGAGDTTGHISGGYGAAGRISFAYT